MRNVSAWFASICISTVALGAAAAQGKPADAQPMKIGIIGAGRIGGTLATLWAKAGHEVLVSPFLLAELQRVLAYPRLRAQHRLTAAGIRAFVADVQAVATVLDPVPSRAAGRVPGDRADEPILHLAEAAQADVLCTLDRHFAHPDVGRFCRARRIQILTGWKGRWAPAGLQPAAAAEQVARFLPGGPLPQLDFQLLQARRSLQAEGQLTLTDIGEGRIKLMDESGIGMQILSLTSPGVEQLDAAEALALVKESNDAVAATGRLGQPFSIDGSVPRLSDTATEVGRTQTRKIRRAWCCPWNACCGSST